MALIDFFGGSKRRAALRRFDAALVAGEVNPTYVDDGMRFAIYKWAEALAPGEVDRLMDHAARLLSYCVLGPAETEATFGPAARGTGEAWLAAALSADDDAFDVKVIKLALARGIAATDIAAQIELI